MDAEVASLEIDKADEEQEASLELRKKDLATQVKRFKDQITRAKVRITSE